jgi:hypothetical protein
MTYLRQFAPAVLAAVQFAGGPDTELLLQAVSMLAGLYATGTGKVPASAPVGFVPTKWAGYLGAAAESGDVTAYRHYWELCALVGLRDGPRSGDVFVPGSRRYADPASSCSCPRRGSRNASSSAPWSANPPPASSRSRRPTTSWTPLWVSWRRCWPRARPGR